MTEAPKMAHLPENSVQAPIESRDSGTALADANRSSERRLMGGASTQ